MGLCKIRPYKLTLVVVVVVVVVVDGVMVLSMVDP